MAFIPESDWQYRGKRDCGFEGRQAVYETKSAIRHVALTGQEPKPVPMYLTRPDRYQNYVNAEIMSNSRSWLGKIADKPTWDLPPGGKQMGVQRRTLQPSPIITPEYITTISGSVRRMGAIDIPTEKLRTIWSEGREVAKRNFAEKTAASPSPIPYQNPPSRLSPLRIGTKPIPGCSNVYADSRPPDVNCVDGFKGVGNRIEVPRKQKEGPAGNALPFGTLPFLGERKPLYSFEQQQQQRRSASSLS